MARTPKAERTFRGVAGIGDPSRPVGGRRDLEVWGSPADRWSHRRNPLCREQPCADAALWALMRRLHTDHPRRWR